MELRRKKKIYKKGLVFVTFKQGVGLSEAEMLIKKFQLKIRENCGIIDGKVMLVVEVVRGREQKWVDKFPRLKKSPIVESAERISIADLH